MSGEQNKRVVGDYVADVLNRGDPLAAARLIGDAGLGRSSGRRRGRCGEALDRTIQLRLSAHRLGLPVLASPRRLARAALQRSARRLGLPRSLAGVRLAQDLHTPAGPAGASPLHSPG